MADESDVVNALVTLIAGTVYPNGTAQPSIVAADVRVFGGWPIPANLDADLSAGKANISVYPRPEERDTSRLGLPYLIGVQAASGTTVNATATTVTFGGSPVAGETVGVTTKAGSFGYAVRAGDTPASIASTFATLTGGTSGGAVLTVANVVSATVEGQYPVQQEVGRQEKLFQVCVWAPTPSVRDALAKAVDASLRLNYRIGLADGTQANTRHSKSQQMDEPQKANLYRRDLFVYAEYATTTAIQQTPAVSAPVVNVSIN